jgi:hypothetical protein
MEELGVTRSISKEMREKMSMLRNAIICLEKE